MLTWRRVVILKLHRYRHGWNFWRWWKWGSRKWWYGWTSHQFYSSSRGANSTTVCRGTTTQWLPSSNIVSWLFWMPLATFTQKSAKLGKFIYLFIYINIYWCRHFYLKMFLVLRHHFAPRHFCPEVGQKNLESRRKKTEFGKILFETFFCTGQHGKTMQDHTKFIRLGVFFWA